MTHYIPPANPKHLVPPLLACLPLAFVSTRPPPALLPILSPILRQRVQILSDTTTQSSESWLPLLCWDPTQASRIAEIIESNTFEPHPVSGEIEYEDAADVDYRLLDEETVQSRIVLSNLGLMVVYAWCQGDQDGDKEGWRVSELLSAEATLNIGASPWCKSITDVDRMHRLISHTDNPIPEDGFIRNGSATHGTLAVGDADDDYWAQYDTSPGRTPAIKRSYTQLPGSHTNTHNAAVSDAEYYAQYAQVQPAMDNHDPSESATDVGQNSALSNTIAITSRTAEEQGNNALITPGTNAITAVADITHAQPSSSLPAAETVDRFEGSGVSRPHAEVAIQQHISTSLKSLFRLAQATGIEVEEFHRLVRTELDTLHMSMDDVV